MVDFTYIIFVLPALLFAFYAQNKVTSNYNTYSRIPSKKGYTAEQVARQLLSLSGIQDVHIEQVRGNLTDHYDPKAKVLRLSEKVYHSTSIAAIGIAAHETGHAIQDHTGYSPLKLRNALVPVVSFSSTLASPLINIGIFLLIISAGRGESGYTLLTIGAILFGGVVLFHLVTLPVEFNASKRAIHLLENNYFLDKEEIEPAEKVLKSAALTYVASAAVAIASLLRILMILSRRRND